MTASEEPKISFQDAYQKLLIEHEELKAKNDVLNRANRNYSSQISQLKKEVGKESSTKPVEAAEIVNQTPPAVVTAPTVTYTATPAQPAVPEAHIPKPEELSPHKFHAWDAGCTTCGLPNPVFKPEMKCDPKKGGCGGILGSFETALQMKNCPHCLKSVEAAPNNEAGLQKAMEFLRTPKISVS